MKISIQFERDFDFFLKKDKRGNPFEYALNRKASVKDIIESLGVPHTEVGHLYFNDQEIDFSYTPLLPGTLFVHAISLPFNVKSPSKLRPVPLKTVKFVADVNVIRAGRLLIMSGFDVTCSPFFSDREIADIAQKEQRIVLTRDTDLLKRKKIVFAKRIKANLPYDQLVEILFFFGLQKRISFFSRCTACNRDLVSVEKKDVLHLLEPKTEKYFDKFFQCPGCKRVFWRGSHYDNIKKKMSALGILIDMEQEQF